MEKVAFIIDGGFFTKKYRKIYKKFPTADDVEKYIMEIFKYLRQNYNYPIGIYRIFYYDCTPLHLYSLAENEIAKNPQSMKKNDFKEICASFKQQYETIKRFHDGMKRKNFFALRMGQLKFQGWEKSHWRPRIKQKGVDMRIGLDIASITTKKLCTKLVLISGDTDMIPAMKTARKEGVHVYWHGMDDGKQGSNLDLATHSDVVITRKLLKSMTKK